MPPTIPELHVAVARAKHELDEQRRAGDELATALAEDRLNAALDELSGRLTARERPARVLTPGELRTAPGGSAA